MSDTRDGISQSYIQSQTDESCKHCMCDDDTSWSYMIILLGNTHLEATNRLNSGEIERLSGKG